MRPLKAWLRALSNAKASPATMTMRSCAISTPTLNEKIDQPRA